MDSQLNVEPPSFAVIFDLDGVLVDTEPLWTRSADLLLERYGHRFDPSLKQKMMGRPALESATILRDRYELDRAPNALVDERLTILTQLLEAGISPMPGASQLVRALSLASIPLGVASGSPQRIVEHVLTQTGLLEYMQAVMGSDQVRHGKPNPEIFLTVADQLHCRPECCLVFEDSEAGILAALAAKMVCIAVASPFTPVDLQQRAQMYVSNLNQLTVEQLRKMVSEST